MKRLIALFIAVALGCTAQAGEKKRFALYAMMMANTQVHLADGSDWVMDKGDTFPVVMFKELQTKIVLQIATTSFMTDAVNVKVLEEKELTPEQVATYRTNVQHYLDGRAAKDKAEQAKAGLPSGLPELPK